MTLLAIFFWLKTLMIKVCWQNFRSFYQEMHFWKKKSKFRFFQKMGEKRIFKIFVSKNIGYHEQIWNFPNS